jgi:uncharacterized membrane protein YkvA (DUF1232 family)
VDALHILLYALLAVLVVLLVLAIAAWIFIRKASAETNDLRKRIGRLPWRAKLRLARLLMSDPAIPRWLRAVPPVLVVYLALPLDIVPDFIPVIGQIDDIVVLAVGVALLLRFVPRAALRDAIEHAEAATRHSPP